MKNGIVLLSLLLLCSICFAQTNTKQQFEIYIMPELFTAQLSHDSLVPPKNRGKSRIGDESIFAVQYGRVFGSHILLKAGIGFSTRDYSLTKSNVSSIFNILFLFDSPPRTDSFPIARVQYKLNYIELPFTIAYEKGKRGAAVQLHYGFTARLQFLTKSNTAITPAYALPVATPSNIAQVEKVYENDVHSFVISLQPYGDMSFRVYKGLGLYLRFSPFSLYASSLNKRISTSQGEFLGTGIGVVYQF